MSNQAGLNIIFAGTPEFAEHHLSALINSHHNVIAVYTQPDRPAGRGKKQHSSPVKIRALEAGIAIEQPVSLKNEDAQQQLSHYKADIMVVVAYGLLLPQPVLSAPRLGCINVHASILPRWRGAAPIQRAIEAGDTETGITIMQMDIGLDTGDMLSKSVCPILASDTANDLHDRLATTGPSALISTLDALAKNTAIAEKQDNSLATYAHKLTKQEAEINWSLPASTIERRIRAFNPFPVATTAISSGKLRIHSASALSHSHTAAPGTILSNNQSVIVACGENTALELITVQLPGKKALAIKQILNGASDKFIPGNILGQSSE